MVLQQSATLTSIGDRPLIVVTAVAEADPGWVVAQENLARLSTAGVHRLMADATHNSLISGVDGAASSPARGPRPTRVLTGRIPYTSGSGGRTRTYDQAVNSRPLYH
jgi:hypothetical protein